MTRGRTLSGLRIVVTRPKEQSAELLAALRRRGARAVPAPALRIADPPDWGPFDRALARLDSFDFVVFTSANAVRAFFARARTRLKARPRPPGRVAAVGSRTASELRRFGWRAAVMPKSFNGASLAGALGTVRGKRILIPRALAGREDLPRLLRARGARVTVAPAYKSEPDPAGSRALRREAASADWATFASPSTVENFWAALGEGPAREFFSRARAASIGPVTSAALRAKGVEPAAEASPSNAEGLAASIASRSAPIARSALRAVLLRALGKAGVEVRRRFLKVKVGYKGKANLITEADHASEQVILDTILARFPLHGFLTEERAPRRAVSDYSWVIDPIDGTTNYAHGYPVCCISVAVLERGTAVLGGIFDPFRDELFLAERGKGAFLNGRRIRVSKVPRISESLLITGFAYDRAERSNFYLGFFRHFMERSHDVRRSGSAALDLAWTAAGRVEGFWEFRLNPWDVAAGKLLVEEAGGKVTDFSGKPWGPVSSWGQETLATNGRIHKAMLHKLGARPGVHKPR